jgi:uncharacterized protein
LPIDMKARPLDPRAVPVASLVRDGTELEGQLPLATLARLGEALHAAPADTELLQWRARFGQEARLGSAPRPWLELQAQADVTLQCQRCLEPMTQRLLVERRFWLAASEAEAARLDAETEDEHLVFESRMDLPSLVEDELILALPLVPRHEPHCPAPLPTPATATTAAPEQPHPFAALAAWRRGREPH